MNEHVEGNWWSNNAGRYAESVFVEMLLYGGLRCDASIVVDNWGTAVEWSKSELLIQQASKQVIPLPNGRQRKQTGSCFLFQLRV